MQAQPGHGVVITGTGSYLPGNPIPADDIDKVLGDFDGMPDDFKKWKSRTRKMMKALLGMEYYYYALDPETQQVTETSSSMGAKAAQKALEMAGMEPDEVDLLIYAGASQDRYVSPPTSVFVQQRLGIKNCAEMSIHSNCTSTYKALQVATDMIAYGRYKNVLVVTSNHVSKGFLYSSYNLEKLTRHQAMIRWFLCDGAGAFVLRRDEGQKPGYQVMNTFLESVGITEEPHMYTQFGSANSVREAWEGGLNQLTQNFQQVSSIGPKFFIDGLIRFGRQLGLDTDDAEPLFAKIKYFLANVPADHLVDVGMDEVKARWGLRAEALRKVYYSTVQNRGYTGPAAVAITLDELNRNKKLSNEEYIVSFVTESSKWMNAGFVLQYRS